MGVKAIDEINASLKDALAVLKEGRLDKEIIRCHRKDADAVIYTLTKASMNLDFLSSNLASRGYGDHSLLGRLKAAFNGLFGGF